MTQKDWDNMVSIATKVLKNKELAEDAVNMAVVKCLKSGSIVVNFDAYVGGSVYNSAVTYKKFLSYSHRRTIAITNSKILDVPPGEVHEDRLPSYRSQPNQIQHIQALEIEAAIKLMKPKQKQILNAYLQTGTTVEAARTTGANVESAKTNLRQARLKIKDIL